MIFSGRKTIGVFLSKEFAVFDEAVFRALERESKRLNYDIVVFTTAGYFLTSSDYDIQEKNIFRLAALEKLDGVIAVPGSYEYGEFRDALLEMLRGRVHCPAVVIRDESEEFPCVFTDDRMAIRQVVRHLIEDHGLKRICFQGSFPGHTEGERREAAYREEMEAHGLPVPESWICPGNMWTNCGETAYSAFFTGGDFRPEAVVCANDYMAVGLMRVLQEHGIRVPEDVIVTGFDNIPRIGVDVPGRTTIQPDFDRMVVDAMEYLDGRIRGTVREGGIRKIRHEGRLILGESCGCCRRPENYFREVSRYALAALDQANIYNTMMNNMSIDLGACDDLTELHETLISDREREWNLRDHYLCLFGDRDGLMREESGTACLVHMIREGKDAGMPMVYFHRSSLLPALAEREDEPQVLFLKLLHQKGRNFGYSVYHYADGAVPPQSFVQMNVLLSIALENIRRQREMMTLYEERRRSSITDLSTGLLNRRGLIESLEGRWESLIGRQVAFICLDMDHLKKINDHYGHGAGDTAIRMVGDAILGVLPPDGLGARIGGDEFVVFLPEAGRGEADAFAERFERRLRRLNEAENHPFQVTASIGYETAPLEAEDTIEGRIQKSDRLMYSRKEERHGETEKAEAKGREPGA